MASYECYVKRYNTIRVTALFGKKPCARCGKKVYWFNMVQILEGPEKYTSCKHSCQSVCNDCCEKAGIKHCYDKAWMCLRGDVNWYEEK